MRRFPVFAFFGLVPLLAGAGEWHVGIAQPFSKIRTALVAASAGDVITVHGGVYREGNLVIDKPVTLIGLNRPRLDGELLAEVITVTAPHVTIRGFEIRDSGSSSLHDLAGIRVANVSHVTIEDNRVLGCNFGIYFAKSRDGIIRHNEVLGTPVRGLENGNGIHAWSCERLELTGNEVRHHRDGIYLEFVTDSRISRNRVSENLRYGLHFMSAHRNIYRENTFLRNGAGVAVMYSREVQMHSNRFSRSWGSAAYGLLLKDITDSRITGNIFEFNSIAVTIQSSNRMVFEHNQFRENGWALQVESSSTDNIYKGNNFFGNSFDVTTNGDLEQNRFDGNYWDKAEIYDLNRDGVGDVPYRPLSLFAKLVDRVPSALLLLRSPLVHFLDRAERIFPTLTPDRLFDPRPAMRPHPL
jgi:nitrous oxidase accessory protein